MKKQEIAHRMTGAILFYFLILNYSLFAGDWPSWGGTHVRNTSEVGGIRVTDYKSKGAINKRIYVEVRDR